MGRKAGTIVETRLRYTIQSSAEFWDKMRVAAKKVGATTISQFIRGSMMIVAELAELLDGESVLVIKDKKTGKEVEVLIVGFFFHK